MMMHDAETGFELGDPQVLPLSENDRLPSHEQLQGELGSMILSASGWRKVFAVSGEEEDATEEIGAANGVLCALIGQVFADYIIRRCGPGCRIALGLDSRPTEAKIGDIIARVLAGRGDGSGRRGWKQAPSPQLHPLSISLSLSAPQW